MSLAHHRRIFLVPREYEIFAQEVRQWIQLLVMSRTVVAGHPMRRERELTAGNDSLRNVWNAIAHRGGSHLELHADFVWGPHHVESIVFSIDMLRREPEPAHPPPLRCPAFICDYVPPPPPPRTVRVATRKEFSEPQVAGRQWQDHGDAAAEFSDRLLHLVSPERYVSENEWRSVPPDWRIVEIRVSHRSSDDTALQSFTQRIEVLEFAWGPAAPTVHYRSLGSRDPRTGQARVTAEAPISSADAMLIYSHPGRFFVRAEPFDLTNPRAVARPR